MLLARFMGAFPFTQTMKFAHPSTLKAGLHVSGSVLRSKVLNSTLTYLNTYH